MDVNLKVGDKAVYPGHGVGQVTSIENKDVLGNSLVFYSLKIQKSGTVIMIPKNRISSIGVRPIIKKNEVNKVLDILSENSTSKKSEEKTWQKRHQAYLDKIKTGSIYEIARVIRDLNHIKKDKDLSYGEKRMMDKAKNMIHSELSLSMDEKDLNKVLHPNEINQ